MSESRDKPSFDYGDRKSIDKKTITKRHYDQIPRKKQQPLLTIELQDETSVPKVFYKGEEIKCKKHVYFDWDTNTDVLGGLSYVIEHAENNNYPVVNRIERRVKGHAFD